MANYQNNMRYSRMGAGGLQQRRNCNNIMPVKESCSESRMKRQSERECQEEFPGYPIAMAYVPWQNWCEVYEIYKGFHRGTIFMELDKPFLGRGGCNQ